MTESFTTEHFDRATDREVVEAHDSWEAAKAFAKRMSDEHDGSAVAIRYREEPCKDPECIELVDFVFGEQVR